MSNFICSGGAELISIAPIYIGHSSPCEIKTYQTLANSKGANLVGEFHDDVIDNVFAADNAVSASEVLEWSSLDFAPTYPCKPAYTTLTLHNFR
jgi:hypothetical protein